MSAQSELEAQWGKETLDERLASKLREYHGLIPRESALLLLSIEAAGQSARPESIAQAMRAYRPSLLRVRVERVFPARAFDKNGGTSRSQRVSVSDQSGSGTLVAYDSACAALERAVVCGDLCEAGPVRLRGGEFHLLPGGEVKRLQKGPRMKIHAPPEAAGQNKSSSVGHFEGVVSSFFGDFPYRKGQSRLSGDAPSSLMSSFELTDSSGRARVVLWDSPGLSGQLKAGTPVEIENGQRRGGEIHIGSSGRLLAASPEGQPRPKIEKMEIIEGKEGVACLSILSSDSRSFVFPSLDEAAARLGTGPVPEGISARTVVELKIREWVGKDLPEGWEKYSVKPDTKA
ncbi:Uncharacterised protein [uncultured archaeon]|nr:Uncharacterised protein [uncultured archaeon]